jgi:hypothetical protein
MNRVPDEFQSRLIQGGVRVVPQSNALSDGTGIISVVLNGGVDDPGPSSFSRGTGAITVRLSQKASLVRDKTISTYVATWIAIQFFYENTVPNAGSLPANLLPPLTWSTVQTATDECADRFLNDYLAAKEQ